MTISSLQNQAKILLFLRKHSGMWSVMNAEDRGRQSLLITVKCTSRCFCEFPIEGFHYYGAEWLRTPLYMDGKCVLRRFCTLSLAWVRMKWASKSFFTHNPNVEGKVAPTILFPSPFWCCIPSLPHTKRFPLDCNRWIPKTNNIRRNQASWRKFSLHKHQIRHANLITINYAEASVTVAKTTHDALALQTKWDGEMWVKVLPMQAWRSEFRFQNPQKKAGHPV